MRKKPVVQNPLYIIMNKPVEYVCSTVSDRRKTVYSLLPPALVTGDQKVFTVGRLDSLSTGLLLFTNDGKLNHQLTFPESHISKTYEVTLQNPVMPEEQARYTAAFLNGVLLPAEKKAGEYFTKPAELLFLSDSSCRVTISEGKFHQVRRMFSAMENQVVTLHRTAIGKLLLPPELKAGEWRFLTPEEIEYLKQKFTFNKSDV